MNNSRFYILSEFCYRNGISIKRSDDYLESDFIFQKGDDKFIFDAYDVLTRPVTVLNKLKDSLGLKE